MPLAPGHLLCDRYRLDRLLAKGGMGAVYAAWDLNLGMECAIKENQLVTEEAMRQFEREARLLAALRHSNLPGVIDHFVIPGQGQYLVMSFIGGEDLGQRLQRLGPLPEEDVYRWALDILSALAYLHQRKIVHRDIKPANIKITPEGHAVLVDFGIAKELGDTDGTTSTGARRLTPGFAPPEQYGAGTGRTDPRSDVYALGATLYTLLTGLLPADALKRLMDPETYIPLASPGLNLKMALAELIDRALALDAKKRFVNGQAMLEALRLKMSDNTEPFTGPRLDPRPLSKDNEAVRVAATDPLRTAVVKNTPATPPPPVQAVTDGRAGRRRLIWWAIATALILLLLIGMFQWGRSLASPMPTSTMATRGPTLAVSPESVTGGSGTETAAQGLDPTRTSQPGDLLDTPQATESSGTEDPTLAPGGSETPQRTATSLILGLTQTVQVYQSTSQSIAATQTAVAQRTQPTSPATQTATAQPTSTQTATTQPTPTPTATARPTLSLNPGSAALVVGAATNLTVSISVAQSSDTVITLASSNSGVASAPGSVTIPAGTTSTGVSVNAQTPGSANITASLPGGLGGGSSTAAITVNKANTGTTISISPNPATVGGQVSVSYSVSASAPGSGTPTGSVTLSDEGGVLCSGGAPSGACSFTANSIGTRTLTATYGGDSNFNGSSSAPSSLTVNPLGISLTPPDSCSTGTNVSLTATISAVQAGDTTIGLSSSSGSVSVPASVTIPAGSLATSFSANGLLIGQATITATLPAPLGGGTATANVRFALPLLGC